MTYSYPSNISGIGDVLQYANDVSGGWLLTMFLIGLFVIIFSTLKLKMYKTSDSLFASSFLTFVFGSLFWAGGFVAGRIIVITLVLVAVCGIYSILDTS